MKVSSEISSIAKLVGEERAVELLAKHGFDAWDFSMFNMYAFDGETNLPVQTSHPLSQNNYIDFAKRLKNAADSCGIVCNQSHAPFPTRFKSTDLYIKRAIECTAEVGGKICVVHPMNQCGPNENGEMYLRLLDFAKSCDVKIATENMWSWDFVKDLPSFAACATPDSFNAHLDAVDDDYFVACLDIGHSEMRPCGTTAVEMIKALGGRLQALHIHDNDLIHDSHLLPFYGSIDYADIVNALKEIGYCGYLTLEAYKHISVNKYTSDTIDDAVSAMASSVKKLADMF